MTEYQLPIVVPDQIPLVDLEIMNQVHREEVVLINRLGMLLLDGLKQQSSNEAIDDCLQEWITHTRDHFDGENRMMAEHGFPPYSVHKGEHDQVLALIQRLNEQWLKHRELDELVKFIFVEWRNWFDGHVKSMDRVTAQFLARFIE
ncbi:MAG: hemerythrin family protein [Candidatus Thiodiazotropha sp. L084R]